MKQEMISFCREKIKNGDVESAVDKLVIADLQDKNTAILLSCKLKNLLHRRISLISNEDFGIEYSRIIKSALGILENEESHLNKTEETPLFLTDIEELINKLEILTSREKCIAMEKIADMVVEYGSFHYNKMNITECIYIYEFALTKISGHLNSDIFSCEKDVLSYMTKKVKDSLTECANINEKAMYLRKGLDSIIYYFSIDNNYREIRKIVESNKNSVSLDYNLRNSIVLRTGIDKIMKYTEEGLYLYALKFAKMFINELYNYFKSRLKWADKRQRDTYDHIIHYLNKIEIEKIENNTLKVMAIKDGLKEVERLNIMNYGNQIYDERRD